MFRPGNCNAIFAGVEYVGQRSDTASLLAIRLWSGCVPSELACSSPLLYIRVAKGRILGHFSDRKNSANQICLESTWRIAFRTSSISAVAGPSHGQQ